MNTRHKQAREIFLEVSDLPQSDRMAALARRCADDAELRAAVEQLLDAEQRAEGFMASPTAKDTPALTPHPELVGTRIGPYKILQLIGEGGFGSVYLAQQDKPVRRRVALKVIKRGMDSGQIIARFEAERQALALMDHPHIAKVLDSGTIPSGSSYFVMEYVVGDSITAFAEAHALGVRARLDLFTQVCSAVNHAHTKGVIHRDLKPGNVLVSMVDGKPFARVIDFGIAKAITSPLTDRTLFTAHGQLIGTPEYMSPEQAEGSPDVDTRSDIYGLGVLLYELLAGAPPFDAKRLRSAAFAEMQRIIREEEPPLPSVRLQRSLPSPHSPPLTRQDSRPRASRSSADDLRGELDWIVMKAIEKDRARRYETPNALAEDIGRHLAGQPVLAAPPSALYRARKLLRRHRAPITAAAVLIFALILGLAGTFWKWRDARNANKAYAQSQSAMRTLTDDLVEGFVTVFSAGPEMVDVRRDGAIIHWNNSNGEPGFLRLSNSDSLDDGITTVLPGTLLSSMVLKQIDEAEWSAYTANLALAQAAIDAERWPEARQRLLACPESKRAWEWTFLDRVAHATILTIPDAIYPIFDPAGEKLLTVTSDDSWELWSTDGQQIGARVRRPAESITSHRYYNSEVTSFSPDGSLILTTSEKGVRLWSLHAQPVGESIEDDRTDGTHLASFSPDGNQILIAMQRGFRLWNTGGDVAFTSPDLGTGDITSVAFSPDGTRILTTSTENMACVWDLTGQPVGMPMKHDGKLVCALYSPDASHILTCSASEYLGTLRLWESAGRQSREISTIEPFYETDYDTGRYIVQFSPDGRYVMMSRGNFKAARQYDLFGNMIALNVGAETWWSVDAYVPDMTRMLTVKLSRGAFALWRDGEGRVVSTERRLPEDHASIVSWALMCNRTGTRMAVGARSGETPPYVRLLPTDGAWNPRRSVLDDPITAVLQREFVTRVPKPATPQPTSSARSDGVVVRCSVTSPDGAREFQACEDRTIRIIDTASGREAATFRFPTKCSSLDFSPDGKQLAISFEDGSLEIWDTRGPDADQADALAIWNQRDPASDWVDRLLAGSESQPDLERAIADARQHPPEHRLAALEVLRERCRDIEAEAERLATEITAGQTDRESVLAAANALNVSPRTRASVLATLADWKPRDPEPTREELAEEVKRRSLAEATVTYELYYRAIDSEERLPDPLNAVNRARAAVDTRLTHLGVAHPDTIDALILLSWLRDDPEQLEARFKPSLEALDNSGPPETFRTLRLWLEYARVLQRLGRYEDSVPWLHRIGEHFLVVSGVDASAEWSVYYDFAHIFSPSSGLHYPDRLPLQRAYLQTIATAYSQASAESSRQVAQRDAFEKMYGSLVTLCVWTSRDPHRPSQDYYALAQRELPVLLEAALSFEPDSDGWLAIALAHVFLKHPDLALAALERSTGLRDLLADDPSTPLVESAPRPSELYALAMIHHELSFQQPRPNAHSVAASKALQDAQTLDGLQDEQERNWFFLRTLPQTARELLASDAPIPEMK